MLAATASELVNGHPYTNINPFPGSYFEPRIGFPESILEALILPKESVESLKKQEVSKNTTNDIITSHMDLILSMIKQDHGGSYKLSYLSQVIDNVPNLAESLYSLFIKFKQFHVSNLSKLPEVKGMLIK